MPTYPRAADKELHIATVKQIPNKCSVQALTKEDIPLAKGDDLMPVPRHIVVF